MTNAVARATSKERLAIRTAVHSFRRSHEDLNKNLKLLAASVLHLEQSCVGDGRDLIASLVIQCSPRWTGLRHEKKDLGIASRAAARLGLVASLAAFEGLRVQLAMVAGGFALVERERTSIAGRVAVTLLESVGKFEVNEGLFHLVDHYGKLRNRLAHRGDKLRPNAKAVAEHRKRQDRLHAKNRDLPTLPTSAQGLSAEQVIMGSSLCLEVAAIVSASHV